LPTPAKKDRLEVGTEIIAGKAPDCIRRPVDAVTVVGLLGKRLSTASAKSIIAPGTSLVRKERTHGGT
jgi:hypothetical protein